MTLMILTEGIDLTVVMISHNLSHVFDLWNRISVMKTGCVVGSRPVGETTREEILRMIVMGRSRGLITCKA